MDAYRRGKLRYAYVKASLDLEKLADKFKVLRISFNFKKRLAYLRMSDDH